MLTSNYTLSVDALSLMFSQSPTSYENSLFSRPGAESFASGATKLFLVHNAGRNFYRYAYEVEVSGKPYGTLYLQSLHRETALAKLTVYNRNLYTDFLTPLRQLQEDFSLKLNNISKLDIAVDTNKNLLLWFVNYFEQRDLYEYRVNQRQQESISTFAKEYRNGNINKTLYPYTVEDKELCIYNKSQEIRDNNNQKYYISDYHRANGLSEQDVFRAEIKLSGSILKTYETVYQDKNGPGVISQHKYDKLTAHEQRYYQKLTQTSEAVDTYKLLDAEYLAAIFNRFAGKHVEFRMYDNANVSRRTCVKLLELDNPQPLTPLTSLALPGKYQQRNNLNAIKVLVQQSFTLALPSLLDSARALADKAGLGERVPHFVALYEPKTSTPLNTEPPNFQHLPF